ncbi:phage tail protein [Pseudomonas sp. NBRC 111142]|uniref:phage tail protein n=1 Tax=Pseudomonas sp. NBRC 111142 TaxID=1661057 RepID=UPI000A55594C|nr:phage tail protein [Pseudomonas sp. NBRC 111142]
MVDQTSQFYAILTNVGAAKQANADALGIPWKITQMGVGDANGTDPTPNATQTRLINEWRRAPLNQLKVDDKNNAVIVAEQVIPADVGGKWIREIALYDADGDMVAVANCPPTFKPLLNQGSGRTQVVRMNLIVSSSSNVQLKIDPSVVLATREYVDTQILSVLPPNKLAGTFTRVRINERGVVQEGFNPTTLDGYGITDALHQGEHGLGSTRVVASAIDSTGLPGGFYAMGEGPTSLANYNSVLNLPYMIDGYSAQFALMQGVQVPFITVRSTITPGRWTPTCVLWHSGNFNPEQYSVKATTLAGYGIEDAFTKTEVNASLQLKANAKDAALTGVPTCPTPAAGTNTNQVANTAFVRAAVSDLVDSAPGALDTLRELAAALGNDPNFATTITQEIGKKADKATTLAGYGIADALKKGDHGLGSTLLQTTGVDQQGLPGGFYAMGDGATSFMNYSSIINLPYLNSAYSAQLGVMQGTAEPVIKIRATKAPNTWTPTRELWHEGNLPKATSEQALAGADDRSWISPLKLFQAISARVTAGFSVSLAQNGFLMFPGWLGGLTFQWGRVYAVPGGTQINYPLAFPNSVLIGIAGAFGNSQSGAHEIAEFFNVTNTGCLVSNSATGVSAWFAIGY